MKKKLIISNAIVVFISLFLMLCFSCIIVTNINTAAAKDEIKNYLEIACRVYDGTNADKTAEAMYSSNQSVRITIISLDGEVLVDTSKNDVEENHLSRPEIKDLGKIYIRHSDTLGYNMMYIAQLDDGAYIRMAIPESKISKTINEMILYGSLMFLIIMGISIFVIYKTSVDALTPISNQVRQLSLIVGKNTDDSNDDIVKLTNQIDDVRKLLDTKINQIEYEKNKLLFVINHIDQGFAVINSSKDVAMINDKALSIFNVSIDSVLNKNYIYLVRYQNLQNAIEKVLIDKKNMSIDIKIENKIYCVALNPFDFNYSTYSFEGVALFILDVTDERNAMIMKREFFANASHELKSPLTTIIGYQQMIQNQIITEPAEIADATIHTIKEANRMNQIIIEMLELSKLESNPMKETSNISLKETINANLDARKQWINDKQLDVDLDIEDFILSINADDLTHLLINLIDNAIKYNNNYGKISIKTENNALIISDTGVGISPEHLPHIFERFYRVDKGKSKELGGTGLGLAIVKHICMIYNLAIEAKSTLGKGTEFKVDFSNIIVK